MPRCLGVCLARTLVGLTVLAGLAQGQVVERERDTKLTGPRGRTIERDIKVERGPGYIDRRVEIKRPGETLIRDTRIESGPGPRPFGPPHGYPGPHGYGGPRFVENVIIERPPVYSAFLGLPGLGFAFGTNYPPPPPPPIFVAPPVVLGPPPPPPQQPLFDPFTDAVGRLKSFHASSRRDGALTLGRLGDPRAVPALNERLEHDFDKDVRVAAAFALGEIADERGAVALEKAVLYEKRHEVRDAARIALQKIPKPGDVSTRPPSQTQPQPESTSRVRREPLDPGPSSPNQDDYPPPPPVPAGRPPTLEPPLDPGPR